MEKIKDRIKSIKTMKLSDIADNPRNPKEHPSSQGETMQGVVKEVGWAGVPLVYPSDRLGGDLAFIDGHLRKREFPDLKVRVAVTDLTDEEADYMLLTYDPIASLATVEGAKMAELLESVESDDEAVLDLLAKMEDDLAGLDYAHPELRERKVEIRDREYFRILISVPIDEALDVRETIEGLEGVPGIEIDYGAN